MLGPCKCPILGASSVSDRPTRREVEVLALIRPRAADGEIVERLVLGESTLTTHVNRVFAKTGRRHRRGA